MADLAFPPTSQASSSSISNLNAPISDRPPQPRPSCWARSLPLSPPISTSSWRERTDDDGAAARPHRSDRALYTSRLDLPVLLDPPAGGDLDVAQDLG